MTLPLTQARRLQAKLVRNFRDADARKAELSALGVTVDDRTRTRSFLPPVEPDYGPLGHDYMRAEDDERELSEEDLGRINELLKDRLEAKLKKRYQISLTLALTLT